MLKKKNTLCTCKQPLMMAYESSKCARDNFGKFIPQIPIWNQDTYQVTHKDLD